jgi:hypothetical protein
MNGPWEIYLLLLSGAGLAGFGYLGFTQRASSAGDRSRLVSILASRVAAAFWLLGLGVAGYFSLVPLDCTNQGDYCALGRVLLYGLVLVAGVVASILAALAWLGYFVARRSAETE